MRVQKLDFSGCRYVYDVHSEIKNALDFPDYYGGNLDALHDCLTDDYGSEALLIEIYGYNFAPEEIRRELEGIMAVFDSCTGELSGFDYKIMS